MKTVIACMLCVFSVPSASALAQEPAAREPGSTEWLEVKGNRIKLYGFPRLDLMYTDSTLAPNNKFPFWVVSEDPAIQPRGDNDEEFEMHPRLSRIGLAIERDSIPKWESASLEGKIEIDFENGGSESREVPRMRHAYLKVKDAGGLSILAGQTWDLISPLLPSVNADSLMWNVGNLGDRRPQLRVGYDFAGIDEATLNATVAIARTGAINNRDLDGDGTADGIDSGKPMVQGRIGASGLFEGRVDVGIWGHIAWDETDVALGPAVPADEFKGQSVGLDLRVRLTDRVTVSGEGWQGQNLDDVRGGIGQGVNVVTGKEIDSRGGWAEIKFKVIDEYAIAVGFGYDSPDKDDLDPTITGGAREKNSCVFLSNHFDLGGGLQAGVEYISWDTNYVFLDEGTANRVNIWMIYKF